MNAGSCGKEETVGSGRGGGEEEKRLGRPKARRRGEEGNAYSLLSPYNVEIPSDTMGLSCTPPPSQLCKRCIHEAVFVQWPGAGWGRRCGSVGLLRAPGCGVSGEHDPNQYVRPRDGHGLTHRCGPVPLVCNPPRGPAGRGAASGRVT